MVPVSFNKGDDRFIIALDFGTTFSGIAYCFTDQRDKPPKTINNWPKATNGEPKIPTVIRYDNSKPNGFTWGAKTLLNPQASDIFAVKLLLDPSQPRPKYLPEVDVERELNKLPKPPVQIAADFIRAVYEHAMSEINLPRDYVESFEKDYVLSVPAVWSDAAKNATLRAAEMAGLSPVRLIKEPEAAALWTSKQLDAAFHSGDTFVVCDAGGGTVDLVSYQVEATLPALKLKEVVPGTGGMAGSLGLNQRFKCAVRRVVGEEQWKKLQPTIAFRKAMESFDMHLKKQFDGDPDDEYAIDFRGVELEDNEDHDLTDSNWTMTGEDMVLIFDPIICDVLKLIKHQVEGVKAKLGTRGPKYIFLVGGFGSNHYLKKRVKEEYPGIEVLQPPDAWAAIAKGAALSRMPSEVAVTSSSSTRHYGVTAASYYDADRDVGRYTWTDIEGVVRAETMTWYIKIGDDLLRGKRMKFPFYRNHEEGYTDSDLVYQDALYECEDEEAPVHPSQEKFRKNCTLISNVSGVPKEKFIRHTNLNGTPYYSIHYDLVITIECALMRFTLEIDGVSYGSVEAKYDS